VAKSLVVSKAKLVGAARHNMQTHACSTVNYSPI